MMNFPLKYRGGLCKIWLSLVLLVFASYASADELNEGENENPAVSGGGAGIHLSFTASPPQIISGAKNRKIALNGFPLADEQPQYDDESDLVNEETYVDALTLQLNHSVTDFYIPVPGSDLALSVRRNVAGSISRDLLRSLVNVSNDPSQVFGVGWSSNLGAHVRLESRFSGSEKSAAIESYAYVMDETGASHRFAISSPQSISLPNEDSWKTVSVSIASTGNQFFPLPANRHDLDTLQSSLEHVDALSMVFTKKYGTKLYYETINAPLFNSYFGYNQTAEATSRTTSIASYYRLTKVEDRYGNTLDYIFDSGNNTLIPDEIRINNDPDRALSIGFTEDAQSTPHINFIEDPKGNRVDYEYVLYTVPLTGQGADDISTGAFFPSARLLNKVLKPLVNGGRPETSYLYNQAVENDLTPDQLLGYNYLGDRYTIPSFHVNLSQIIDANGNTYQFEYNFDNTNYAYTRIEGSADPADDFIGYYPTSGQPQRLSKIKLPIPSGAQVAPPEVTLVPAGLLQYYPRFLEGKSPLINEQFAISLGAATGSRSTVVTDAEGNSRTYTFSQPVLFPLSESVLEYEEPDPNSVSAQAPPVFAAYRNMSLDLTGLGSESITYDFSVGSAPITVTDFSGNQTTFEYDDFGSSFVSEGGTNILERNPEPTARIDSFNNRKIFKYDLDNFYIMSEATDELGQITETPVDSLGRRTDEKKYDSSGNLLQHTDFDYDSIYLGVVNKETLKTLPGDPSWAADLVTNYEIYGSGDVNGPAGLIKKQIVDPTGENLITEYTYDLNGNRTSITDPRGYTTYFVYDALNRLTDVVHPPATSASDTSAPRIQHVYDLRSNKVGLIDENGNITVTQYDEFNRPIKVIRVMGSHTLDVSDPDTFSDYSPVAGVDLVTEQNYNLINAKTSVTDPNGNTTSFYYDAINRLIGQKEPAVEVFDPVTGQSGTRYPITWFHYGENCGGSIFETDGFKPTHSVDARGYLTVVAYDDLYRPVNTATQYTGTTNFNTDPETFPIALSSLPVFTATPLPADNYAQTVNQYDAVGNLRYTTDDLSRITETQYDGMNRPVKIIHPDLTEVEMAYTGTGLEYQSIDELDRVTLTEYDGAARPVKVIQPSVSNALTGLFETPVIETVYDANGNISKTINPLNQTWDYEYDERNRQTKEIQPSVSFVEHSYNLATSEWDEATGTARPEITTTYDNVGNTTSVTDPRGNPSYTIYDQANRPTVTITPRIEVYDVSTDTTQSIHSAAITAYDLNGNIDKQQVGSIQTTISSYTEALNATITIERTQIDNTWDAFNRLIDTTDAENIVVTNKYDASSNRTAVVDGKNQRTEFDYDGLARNVTTRHPDLSEKTLIFNALFQTKRTDEKGQITTYTYDSRNRLDTVDYADDGIIDRDYTYDLVGNILSVDEVEDYQDVAYTYDTLNRIESETSNGLTHTYTYDLAGNRISNRYGDGQGVAQLTLVSTYDALNRTQTIFEDGNNNGTYEAGERLSAYGYDLGGSIRKKDQPNGHTITKICDTLNRAIRIIGPNGLDSAPLYQYENIFDLHANVTRIDEIYVSTDSQLNDRTIINTYDDINRLTDETIITGAVTISTVYGYDDAHNRTSTVLTSDDGTATSTLENSSYVYSNSLNQITSYTDSVSGKNVSYTYDLNGNRETSQTDTDGDTVTDYSTQYGYDYENRLLSYQKTEGSDVDTYAYGYDYRTRRTLRDESGADDANQLPGQKTYLVFSGGLSVQEWQDVDGLHVINPGSDSLEVEYVRGSDYGGGIGGILYTLRGSDASIKHYNSRGDVVAAVNGIGSLTYQAAYEAFGRHGDTSSSEEWGSTLDRQQANTKDEDPTGLLNEGFRYRDLETDTFITRDPLGFVDGPNMYTYVVQNPWTHFDPHGLQVANTASGPALVPGTYRTALGSKITIYDNGFIGVRNWLGFGEEQLHGMSTEASVDFLTKKFGNDAMAAMLGVVVATELNEQNKENQNQPPSDTARPEDGEGPTVYRYVGEEEAAAAEKDGVIPNTDQEGNPKDVYVTPDRHESASEAEEALQIGSKNPNGATPTPTHRIEGDATGVQFDQAGRVDGGTGTELTTRQEIPVKKVEPIEEE